MDLYSLTYENFIFLGGFNAGMEHSALKDFSNLYFLTSLFNRPTCWKNPSKPTCIDLILTNRPKFFQNTNVIETGLSDFHKMVVTIMKTSFRKLKPKIINYRKYKNFSNDIFRDSLLEELSQVRINNDDDGFNNFLRICRNTLDRFAPRKKKYIRGNNAPFMNKTLSKEIMKRSNLRNKYLKSRSEEDRQRFRKQRNLCVSLLRKIKRSYYSNLNKKNLMENRKFWKTVKPMLPNNFVNNEKITSVDNEKIITNDKEISKVLNDFLNCIKLYLII